MKSIKSNQKGSLTGRLLRLLKANGDLQESITLQENDVSVGILDNNYHVNQKDVKAALLEAERKKANAIETQRRRFIC
jgi:hypothetical protein